MNPKLIGAALVAACLLSFANAGEKATAVQKYVEARRAFGMEKQAWLTPLAAELTQARTNLLAAFADPEMFKALSRDGVATSTVADLIAAYPAAAEADLKALLVTNYIRAREAALRDQNARAVKHHAGLKVSDVMTREEGERNAAYTNGAWAIISALAPITVVDAAKENPAYRYHAADVWAQKLAPESWKAANARLAGR